MTWGATLIRHLQTAAVIAGFLFSPPVLAGDLIVENATPPAANAASRGYATVFGGVSLPSAEVTAYDSGFPIGITFDLSFDPGFIVGGAVGTTVLPRLRGEVEFSVVKSSISEFYGMPLPEALDSTGYNLLGNLWYDVETNTAFMPYIGGGIGWGYDVVTDGDADEEITTSGFLYQLGVGVRVPAAENVAFDLGYRYRVQPEADVSSDFFMMDPDDSIKSSATNHIVQAGVTVGF